MKRLLVTVLIGMLISTTVFADLAATEGLAIDLSSVGAGLDITIAFDPTELLGSRTWGDASTNTIVWTWNRATGTDPTLTFGDGMFTFGQDLTISGDDLFMATNTTGMLLIADGTNFNPIAMGGDATIVANGTVSLGTDSVGDNEVDYTEVTLDDFDYQTAWRLFYSDGSGDVTELTFGSNGQFLKSQGVSSIPTWDTPGAAGTLTTIKEDNSQVGGADIVTLDFLGADFDLTESPDTEMNIIIASALTRDAEINTYAKLLAFTNSDANVLSDTSIDIVQNKTISASLNTLTNIDEDDCADGSDLVTSGIAFVIDGGGSAITTGIKGVIEIPFNCTIIRATLLGDQTGTIEIDLRVETYANYSATVPDSGDSIIGATGTDLKINAGVKYQDSTFTNWTTTSLTAGSIIRYYVVSSATTEECTVSLIVEK